ncbi:MAG: DHH family phosphoesterase, partial [Bacteroidales bacterium]|nr:DHH family phosphoesterase [Bacteroidales bacterium]
TIQSDDVRIAALRAAFAVPRRAVLVAHKGPDGDALGSLLALQAFLLKQGHTVCAVTPNACPEFLRWMPGYDRSTVYMTNRAEVDRAIAEAEYIFHLDYNDLARTSDMAVTLSHAGAVHILIDHHLQPVIQATWSFSEPSMSATAELLYEVLHAWDASLIDRDIATCIYAGMMTDTGCFSYNVPRSETFRTVAALMDYGIDRDAVSAAVYDNYSEHRQRLLGYCLSRKMEVYPEQRAALIVLTRDEQLQYHYVEGDSEGFVNYPFAIRGIRFVAFIREDEDRIKVSLRSRGDFDVNEIARRYFNGGGHRNAAGGDMTLPLQTVVGRFYQVLENL